MMAVFRDHEWGDSITNLLDIVAAMPSDQYGRRPAPGLRSFGEVVGHITNVQLAFCRLLDGQSRDSTDWEKHASKDEVVRGLKLSIDQCDGALDRLTDQALLERRGGTIAGDVVVMLLGHTKRETGKLVTYLRLAGVTPPEIHYARGRTWRTP